MDVKRLFYMTLRALEKCGLYDRKRGIFYLATEDEYDRRLNRYRFSISMECFRIVKKIWVPELVPYVIHRKIQLSVR